MGYGWIKISKALPNHWLWQDAERLQWWLDLLMLANWEDGKVVLGGELHAILRGQMIASIDFLCDRWSKRDKKGKIIEKPSTKRVLKFIKMLEDDGMISRDFSNYHNPILTICNYERYQAVEAAPEQPKPIQTELFPEDEVKSTKPKKKQAVKHHYRPTVLLTEDEYGKLAAEFSEEGAQWMVQKLDDYKAAKGATYKSDYRAIRNWVVGEYQIQKNQAQYGNTINRTNRREEEERARAADLAQHIASKLQGGRMQGEV